MKTLAEAYKDDCKIGVALSAESVQSHAGLVSAQFNSITCENEMKFQRIHPAQDEYNFEPADKIYRFAVEHGIPLRGHTFVWHQEIPHWLVRRPDGTPATREDMLAHLREHMETLMHRYGRNTWCWDVVNEAVYDESSLPQNRYNALLRRDPWTDLVGEDYVEQAFRMAEHIAPNAQLIYNEYAVYDPAKCDRIYTLVKGLLDRGVKVDGIGMQGHWSVMGPDLDALRRSIDRLASLKLPLQITEMDLSLYPDAGGPSNPDTPYDHFPAELLEQQAARYEQYFSLLREYRGLFSCVTFWGAADDVSWLNYWPLRGRCNQPLLFDRNQQPKEAFYRVLAAAGVKA